MLYNQFRLFSFETTEATESVEAVDVETKLKSLIEDVLFHYFKLSLDHMSVLNFMGSSVTIMYSVTCSLQRSVMLSMRIYYVGPQQLTLPEYLSRRRGGDQQGTLFLIALTGETEV